MSAVLAQLVERTTEDRAVAGSKPADGKQFFFVYAEWYLRRRARRKGKRGGGIGRGGENRNQKSNSFIYLSPLFFFPLLSLPFPSLRHPRAPPFHYGLFRRHPRSLERDRRQARGARTRRRRQGRAQAGEVIFFLSWLALVSIRLDDVGVLTSLYAFAFGLVFPDELA